MLLELIKAELMGSCSYLTQLAMKVNPNQYHTIHKLFNRVRFDIVAIQIAIITFIIQAFGIVKLSISIDDTIVYRSRNKKVPRGHKQFDHANKANRSSYVFGQRWLAFGLGIEIGGVKVTLPLFIYLVKPDKNLISTAAIVIAKIKRVIERKKLLLEVTILTDSWFARKRLTLRAKRCGFRVITMARRDTALYKLPPYKRRKAKGRPKIKGKRIEPTMEGLKKESHLQLYGKEVKVRYKQAICKARFLEYETIKAVWVAFDDATSMRLLISTDTSLGAEDIIKQYATRWDIEPMFNTLKNRFKFKDIMMHTTNSYYQFLYFKLWCYIIIKLASIESKETIVAYIKKMLPWRVHFKKGVTLSAGSTQLALQSVFNTLDISMFFPKVKKSNRRNTTGHPHSPQSPQFMGDRGGGVGDGG